MSFKILEALSRVILTCEVLKEKSLEEVSFKSTILGLLKSSPSHVRSLVSTALWLFELSAIIFHGKLFTRLNPLQQKAHFRRWMTRRSYLVYIMMRSVSTFVYSAYYSHPEVAESLGFREIHVIPALSADGGRESSHVILEQRVVREMIGETTTGSPPMVSARGGDDKQSGILNIPEQSTELEVEICVIGSGAGGAVVAKELAEKGHEVLILEEGGYFSQEDFKTLPTLERNKKIYRDGGIYSTLGVPLILLPTGKCVGGTTVINSGTCYRTPDFVFERWQKEFGLRLSAADFIPYFEKVEKTLGVSAVAPEVYSHNDQKILEGALKQGIAGHPLFRNAPGCQGSGVCIFGCPTGAKQSMERSYLPLAFVAGARLYPHCHVEQLLAQSDKVYKIEAYFTDPATGKPKNRLTVFPKKVVVCAGTLATPLLLRRSHIGGRSGQLGKNLSIHPTAKMMGIFDDPIDGFRGVPQGMGMDEFQREGLLLESVFFPPWLLATSIHHTQEKHREIMQAYRRIGIFGFMVHDRSRGRVYQGPGGRPIVCYNIGKRERDLFVKGLKLLARIFFSAGARTVYPTIRTIEEISSVEEMERIVPRKVHRRDLESAAFHPLGTCRMGIDPHSSVVNEQMKLHDMENVWVADGSVFPTSVAVNPQISIMAFATRCAEMIDASTAQHQP